jgi:hypothetical protein
MTLDDEVLLLTLSRISKDSGSAGSGFTASTADGPSVCVRSGRSHRAARSSSRYGHLRCSGETRLRQGLSEKLMTSRLVVTSRRSARMATCYLSRSGLLACRLQSRSFTTTVWRRMGYFCISSVTILSILRFLVKYISGVSSSIICRPRGSRGIQGC